MADGNSYLSMEKAINEKLCSQGFKSYVVNDIHDSFSLHLSDNEKKDKDLLMGKVASIMASLCQEHGEKLLCR